MKIGIIGAGMIGSTLTRRLTALGHDVRVANSRSPETLEELAEETGATPVWAEDAVDDVELVVVTIPEKAVTELPDDLFADVADDVVVVDALGLVKLLLLLERVLVEELLQLLVGVVDAHLRERVGAEAQSASAGVSVGMRAYVRAARLLKGVGVEDLEAEDVEDADEAAARALERAVDPLDEPVEERVVDRLSEGGAHLCMVCRM